MTSPGPHQVPQGGQHRRLVEVGLGGSHRPHQLVPERGASCGQVGPQGRRGPGRRGRRRPTFRGTSTSTWSRNTRRRRPSPDPSGPGPHPHQIASRAEGVEVGQGGSRPCGPAARRPPAPRRGSTRRPARRPPRPGRPGPRRGRPIPCQGGQEATEGGRRRRARPRNAARARDRRRSWRRTSGSHHSRSAPPGRNSPRTSATGGHRGIEHRADPVQAPRRGAPPAPRSRNGPWVRA